MLRKCQVWENNTDFFGRENEQTRNKVKGLNWRNRGAGIEDLR